VASKCSDYPEGGGSASPRVDPTRFGGLAKRLHTTPGEQWPAEAWVLVIQPNGAPTECGRSVDERRGLRRRAAAEPRVLAEHNDVGRLSDRFYATASASQARYHAIVRLRPSRRLVAELGVALLELPHAHEPKGNRVAGSLGLREHHQARELVRGIVRTRLALDISPWPVRRAVCSELYAQGFLDGSTTSRG
jgi:hypothetical protein